MKVWVYPSIYRRRQAHFYCPYACILQKLPDSIAQNPQYACPEPILMIIGGDPTTKRDTYFVVYPQGHPAVLTPIKWAKGAYFETPFRALGSRGT